MPLEETLERIRSEQPDEDEPATEAEEGEEEQAEEEEAEQQPEAATEPPFDPAKLEKELKRHATAMERLLGDGWADMQACDVCGTSGYVPRDFTPAPEMLPNPDLVTCRDCNGYGKRLTPALDPQYQLEPCTKCSGRGFVDRATYEQVLPVAAQPVWPQQQQQPLPPQWNPATQQWETPNGQPLGPPAPPPAPTFTPT